MKVLLVGGARNSGLVVTRSLARAGHDIVVVDDHVMPSWLRSRFASDYVALPPDRPGQENESVVQALLDVVEHHRPDVLLPISMTKAISRNREIFEKRTRVLIASHEILDAVDNKATLPKLLNRYGVPHPKILSLSEAEAKLVSGELTAVVVKPTLNLGAGEGVSIVSRLPDFRESLYGAEQAGGSAVISEYIPGPDTSNYALQTVFDRQSRPLCAFVLRKIRLYPSRVGFAAAAVTCHAQSMVDSALEFLQNMKWVGPADVEFKLDARDDKPKLIEINPRFSGSVAFAMACGVDIPSLTVNAAAATEGATAAMPDYRDGIVYWNPNAYIRATLAEIRGTRRPMAALARARAELRQPRVGNPYDLTDIAPTIGKFLHNFRKSRRA